MGDTDFLLLVPICYVGVLTLIWLIVVLTYYRKYPPAQEPASEEEEETEEIDDADLPEAVAGFIKGCSLEYLLAANALACQGESDDPDSNLVGEGAAKAGEEGEEGACGTSDLKLHDTPPGQEPGDAPKGEEDQIELIVPDDFFVADKHKVPKLVTAFDATPQKMPRLHTAFARDEKLR
eukprot:TRINITY_DN7959_c0_g1_i1.p1 TRINITY_DN7959_c0_g1~~TRINITY_DN7959_c0_g1_i1.p1  ORF type:complete len:179 (+),score=45.19 TRINITY_DN7959_c0_g1_i1:124-660(+)